MPELLSPGEAMNGGVGALFYQKDRADGWPDGQTIIIPFNNTVK